MRIGEDEARGARTSLPASLALAIWASNSSLVWHAITTPSSDAIPVLFFLGGIESFCRLTFLSRAGLQDCVRGLITRHL